VTWKDQGRGNRKGKVKVALMRKDQEIASQVLFDYNAPHSIETKERILKTEDVITKAQLGDKYALNILLVVVEVTKCI
jgi:hypothetical protein